MPSNGICRGFAIKYGKFLLPPRFLTALSLPNVPACKQFKRIFISIFNKYFILCNTPNICYDKNDVVTHHNACNVTHGVYWQKSWKEVTNGRIFWCHIKNKLYTGSFFWYGLSFPSGNTTRWYGGLGRKRFQPFYPQYREFPVPYKIWARCRWNAG